MNEEDLRGSEARQRLSFLSHEETAALGRRGVLLPDPGSVLVSPDVLLEEDVVLWPNVILQTSAGGRIVIGRGANLFPGTRIVATGGSVTVGAGAEIGEEGGFTVKAGAGDTIEIGDGARLLGGGSLILSNRIGRGAQILGPVRCQNCTLGDGLTYRDSDPDERGGVLKGSGVARGIEVPRGHVIQAFGLFSEAVMRPQSYFHPKG
jgi:bifunctional N-acetylglucosamine-1-phosphate-uridyltransferase/glucosamine-1-phosphate-acetyltransferase GlmU-like protein